MPSIIYALSIDATADAGNHCSKGERRSLLVLARAASSEEAVSTSLVALKEYRWTETELKNVAALNVGVEAIADPAVREAAIYAKTHGYALVVF